MGFTFDYWVPHVIAVYCPDGLNDSQSAKQFEALLKATPSQNEGSHFEWKREKGTVIINNRTRYFYKLYTVAVHWTHDIIEKARPNDGDIYGLLNFTTTALGSRNPWEGRCITSHEITYTDKGKANSKFENVYHDDNR